MTFTLKGKSIYILVVYFDFSINNNWFYDFTLSFKEPSKVSWKKFKFVFYIVWDIIDINNLFIEQFSKFVLFWFPGLYWDRRKFFAQKIFNLLDLFFKLG